MSTKKKTTGLDITHEVTNYRTASGFGPYREQIEAVWALFKFSAAERERFVLGERMYGATVAFQIPAREMLLVSLLRMCDIFRVPQDQITVQPGSDNKCVPFMQVVVLLP